MSMDFITQAVEGVRGLQPYQPGKPVEVLERELGIKGAIKLASNENPLGPSPAAIEAIGLAERASTIELSRYPDGNVFDLKSALSGHYNLSLDHITLGNGSNDLLELVARVFTAPGEEIIYSQYAFIVYALTAKAIGAASVETPALDWGHDLEKMAAAVTPQTKVIFIANPNNPTGTVLAHNEVSDFLTAVPERVIVVLDEAYYEYNQDPEYPDSLALLERHPNLVVARTFSKIYGLAGLRVGYTLSHPDIADLLNRVRQPFNVNSLALMGATAALADSKFVERSRILNSQEREKICQALANRGVTTIPSSGNFITIDVGRPAMPVYEAMLRSGVIVRPIGGYGMPNHLRSTIGLPEENERMLDALFCAF
jgi:histidinol-phosphate aminotransferase